MVIGFDGKRLYDNKTGLGNYSRTLLHRLLTFYPNEEYKIFVHQKYSASSSFLQLPVSRLEQEASGTKDRFSFDYLL